MAQTITTKDKQAAIDKYDRASCIKQRIIWLYFKAIQTNNTEGLSPTGVVDGVTDYSISGNVKYYLTQKQFSYRAMKLCEIALELCKDNCHIEEPALDKPAVPVVTKEGVAPTTEAFEIEIESDDDYKEEEEQEQETPTKKQKATPKKSTPKKSTPRMAKKATPRKVVSIDELAKSLDGTTLKGLPQMASAGLGFPVLCGRYTEDKIVAPFKVESKHYTLIRMIPHNCLTENMVTLEWTDSQTLVVVFQWPSLFWKIGNHIAFQKDSSTPPEFHCRTIFRSYVDKILCKILK
jgi:hypothetical protein